MEPGACCDVEEGSATREGTSTESFWKSERLATKRREKGEGLREPSNMGFMKRGQRRRHTDRKERISRPECLERESQIAEQYLVQTSFVSFFPCGSSGEGSVRARI